VETTDAWIRDRTGNTERRICAEKESTTDLAEKALRQA
jgi:3-oxoacyl-[acyl-carrier-protein] synthase-3